MQYFVFDLTEEQVQNLRRHGDEIIEQIYPAGDDAPTPQTGDRGIVRGWPDLTVSVYDPWTHPGDSEDKISVAMTVKTEPAKSQYRLKRLGEVLLNLELEFKMLGGGEDANREFLQFTQDLEQIHSIIASASSEANAFRVVIDKCLKSLLLDDKRAVNYDIVYVKKDDKIYALARVERSGEGGSQLAIYPYFSSEVKKSRRQEEIDWLAECLYYGITNDFYCEKAQWYFAGDDEKFFKSSSAFFGTDRVFCADEDYIGTKL